jgi:hypothetical protein
MPFDATSQTPWAIPFAFADYLELVDWTGRAIRSDKRGYIPSGHPVIPDRLGVDPEQFIGYSERMLKAFGTAVGAPASLASPVRPSANQVRARYPRSTPDVCPGTPTHNRVSCSPLIPPTCPSSTLWVHGEKIGSRWSKAPRPTLSASPKVCSRFGGDFGLRLLSGLSFAPVR